MENLPRKDLVAGNASSAQADVLTKAWLGVVALPESYHGTERDFNLFRTAN